jgi:hypothetical protein
VREKIQISGFWADDGQTFPYPSLAVRARVTEGLPTNHGTANGLQTSSMSALKLFSPSDIALTEAGLFGNYKVARRISMVGWIGLP